MDEVHSIYSDVPLISVVAPVYKVEPFLQECIDSVLNQSFKDFELILVDDGSPDKCGEICDKVAEKDSRIRVFHQENGGVSLARRLGVENAKGEWICFVDPDDRLPTNALQDLISACDTLGYNIDDFDIIEGGHTDFKVNEKTGKEQSVLSENVLAYKRGGTIIVNAFEYARSIVWHYYNGGTYWDKIEDSKGVIYQYYFGGGPCRKIIRKSLLVETDALTLQHRFFQFEDLLSNLKLAKKLRKAIRIPKIVYERRINPNGSIRNKDKYCTFEYRDLWWKSAKEVLQDMPEDWQELYKILVVEMFCNYFADDKGKTWHLRSPEFAPYLSILFERKDLLPIVAKMYLLPTRFPFTLLPERFYYLVLFGTKLFFKHPYWVMKKLWKIIRRYSGQL